MKAITFDRFDAGIDLRKGATVADANRMRDMLNCDVTNGLAISKRPGLRYIKSLSDDSVGLFALGAELSVVTQSSLGSASAPVQLFRSLVVSGFLYVVVKLAGGETRHYWHDAGTGDKAITDALCPHTRQVVGLAGKVFAPSPDGSTVRFSATNNPRDWTTADDAGFLPISHHGGGRVTALAVYRGMLAVFTDSHVQIWRVDPDPAQHSLVDIAHGIGSEHPFSITPVSGDVLFMGAAGVRSLSSQAQSGNLVDLDIGSPIDSLAVDMMARNPQYDIIGHYSQALGKFLLFMGAEVLVYSFSRSSKMAAWSRWVLPSFVQGAAELMGSTYIRIGNQLHKLDPDQHTDSGNPFPVSVDFGYLALKAPGSLKRLIGMDAVIDGECNVSMAYNEAVTTDEGVSATLSGDTRPHGTIPIELHGTAFAPRFRCTHDKPFRLDLLTLYYDVMGVR
ncbi:hypothetical protein [Thiothrix sp.]|jgi:hypothetical protein|uniref:hypothetical protein n=1 Tax=Thiothrix sp. TaxID=1032 RepID=UPI00257FBE95|nr:hypothetical protein [Thiothrix sp.]